MPRALHVLKCVIVTGLKSNNQAKLLNQTVFRFSLSPSNDAACGSLGDFSVAFQIKIAEVKYARPSRFHLRLRDHAKVCMIEINLCAVGSRPGCVGLVEDCFLSTKPPQRWFTRLCISGTGRGTASLTRQSWADRRPQCTGWWDCSARNPG